MSFEKSAWFLPGNIHGCADQVYRIYANYYSIKPSWEVQPIWAEQIIKAYQEAECAPEEERYDWFEDVLSADCQGQWGYVDMASEYGQELTEAYPTADFYGCEAALPALIEWARQRTSKKTESVVKTIYHNKKNN